jgi:hypothetical protein
MHKIVPENESIYGCPYPMHENIDISIINRSFGTNGASNSSYKWWLSSATCSDAMHTTDPEYDAIYRHFSWCTKTSGSSSTADRFRRAGAQIHAESSGHRTRLTLSRCVQPLRRSSRYMGLSCQCMKVVISPSVIDCLERASTPIQARSGGHPTLLTGSKCASFLRSAQYEEIDLPWPGELSNLRSHALSPVPCTLNRPWFYGKSLADRGTQTAPSRLLILYFTVSIVDDIRFHSRRHR